MSARISNITVCMNLLDYGYGCEQANILGYLNSKNRWKGEQGHKDRTYYCTKAEIAEVCRCSVKTVERTIRKARKDKLLVVTYMGRNPSGYRVRLYKWLTSKGILPGSPSQGLPKTPAVIPVRSSNDHTIVAGGGLPKSPPTPALKTEEETEKEKSQKYRTWESMPKPSPERIAAYQEWKKANSKNTA